MILIILESGNDMLKQERKQKAITAKIDENQKQRIRDFIQGSIYCFCKNCPDQWFAARDLFGGENTIWQGTPLVELYYWHRDNNKKDPVSMAGIDVGHLLLDIIIKDKREFELNEGYTLEYKWIKKEGDDEE